MYIINTSIDYRQSWSIDSIFNNFYLFISLSRVFIFVKSTLKQECVYLLSPHIRTIPDLLVFTFHKKCGFSVSYGNCLLNIKKLNFLGGYSFDHIKSFSYYATGRCVAM